MFERQKNRAEWEGANQATAETFGKTEENRLRKPETKKGGAMRAAFIGLTAGLALFGAVKFGEGSADAAERHKTKQSGIELAQPSPESTNEMLRRQRQTTVDQMFKGKIKLGQPKEGVRCQCEQWGVYSSEGKHIADVYSAGLEYLIGEFIEDMRTATKGIDREQSR